MRSTLLLFAATARSVGRACGKPSLATLALLAALSAIPSSARAAKVGEPAPDFSGTDTKGNAVSLSQFKGKYLVLEWHNKDCPYVKAQYKSGHMQALQKEWTGKGVAWLEIVSSKAGAQGYVTAKQGDQDTQATGASPSAMILDPTGVIGHAYGAQTTPHMFVVDPKGSLIYNGGLDGKPANDPADVAKSGDFVSLALTEAMAGKALSQPTSKPYGCSVKY